MSEYNTHNEELNDLAAHLAQLVPEAAGLHRDRILFEAGRRAGRRQARPWHTVVAGITALAAVAITWNVAQQDRSTPMVASNHIATAPLPAERPVLSTSSQLHNSQDSPKLSSSSYLAWRTRIARADFGETSTPLTFNARAHDPQAVVPAPMRRTLERSLLTELLAPAQL